MKLMILEKIRVIRTSCSSGPRAASVMRASSETVVEVVLNLLYVKKYIPYFFYDTLWVIKFTLVSALILCPKQPWWSAAFAHIIVWCKTMSQPSTQVSSLHHGRCHLHLVWAQSIWGASGTCHYHHDGKHINARFAMILYESMILNPPSSPITPPSFPDVATDSLVKTSENATTNSLAGIGASELG